MKRGIEDVAIARSKAQTGFGWSKFGFKKELVKFVEEQDAGGAETIDTINNRMVVPDGWFVDKEANRFCVLEIEDTNPMSRGKLTQYSEIWFAFDCSETSSDFALYVGDRYGDTKEVPLVDIWYAFLAEKAAS